MSFASSCAYLVAASLRNFAAHQLRRLRKPRYLIPAALALLYFSWVLRQTVNMGRMSEILPGIHEIGRRAEPIAVSLFAAGTAATWVFGRPRPRLVFTEAEVQFLFAAPATRRQVVHYGLVKVLLQSFLVATILALFFGSGSPGAAASVAVGAWLSISALSFHGIGASFARAWLHERTSGLRLRMIQLCALAILAGTVAWAVRAGSLSAGPLSWALWPARALVRPALAREPGRLLWALPPALLLLAIHYVWVLVAADRFEDAAVEAAERVTRRLEVLRAGGATAILVTGKSRAIPFRLRPSARPETALAWKGLIGISRSLVLRALAVTVPLGLGIGAALVAALSSLQPGGLAGVFCATLLFLTVGVGPTLTGGGLAADLRRLDFLRTLPLPGSRIVVGQALAPAFLLATAWTALVLPASLLFPAPLGGLERTCIALTLAAVGPPLLLLAVLLQAALVVVLPGWTMGGPGPLTIGRTLVASFVHFIGLPLLSLPAAVPGAVLALVGHRLLGWPAVPIAGAAAASLLVGEVALAAGILGRVFDALDPSDL